MTTYQDPQPQSRRAARNSERAESDHTPTPFEAAAEMWDTNSRRAAGLAPTSPRSEAPTSGRRAEAAPTGEPLGYVTQQRGPAAPEQAVPDTPVVSTPQFRPRGTTPQPQEAAPQPPTEALPVADTPRYRLRDYSPEGTGRRAAAPAPAPEWTQPYDPLNPGEADLGYQTERRVPVAPAQPVSEVPVEILQSPPRAEVSTGSIAPSAEVPPSVAQVDAPPVPDAPAPERTLTRREMRALVEAEQATASGPLPLVAPEPKPTTGLTNAISEFDALMARAAAAAPVPVEAPIAPEAWQIDPLPEPTPTASAPSGPPEPTPSAPASAEAPPADQGASDSAWPFSWSEQASAPVPVVSEEVAHPAPGSASAQVPTDPPSAWDVAATPQPAETVAPVSHEPESRPRSEARGLRPTGHWAAQLDDDGDEVMETTVNRTIGTATVTTNALVLPTTPDTDIRGPLTSTGEILLTGSIDLPASLASTGVTSRIESSGMDHLFETHDAEVVSTDSKPVSAIRAVSTQSGSGLTHAPKSKGNRALTALLVAAVGMGVVVVGLLGLALAFGAFS
jgi:hypothetical protein